MIINKSNAEIINTKEVYIHDDILLSFNFDRDNKVMNLKFQKYEYNTQYVMKFNEVIGFKMTSCDYWGSSECIFDFEYVDPQENDVITELIKRHLNTPNSGCKADFNNFIEVLFTFASGDQLKIACKTIIIQNL